MSKQPFLRTIAFGGLNRCVPKQSKPSFGFSASGAPFGAPDFFTAFHSIRETVPSLATLFLGGVIQQRTQRIGTVICFGPTVRLGGRLARLQFPKHEVQFCRRAVWGCLPRHRVRWGL